MQNILQAPLETIKSTIMPASTNDTSFAAHVANQFTSFEKDRQADSKQTLYTTR
jgi:hypothetical protein